MRLEDMSFTDYLTAEFDLREMQRKERMKQAEFEKYAKEHNLFICTTNIIEQIREEIEDKRNVAGHFDTKTARAQVLALSWVLDLIDKYTKGEGE